MKQRKVNCQQIPNDYEVLSAFVARDKCKWLISDFAALEPVCLSEASQDHSMLAVYGKDAKPNDLYLFTGSQLKGLSHYFTALGYDPYNPTKEAIDKCKKEAKKWRQVSKVVCLSSSYGAGPGKIRQTLALQGIELSLAQVKEIHSAYWNLYGGVKRYEKYLQNQWEKNGGWFFNGLGRPVCVDQSVIKDCVNRSIQSLGHDNMLIYLWILRKHLERENIPFNPIIWDLHDAVFIEVPDENVDKAKEIIDTVALNEFNALIRAKQVTLKLEANVVNSFAEDKVEKLEEAMDKWDTEVAMLGEEEDGE